LSRQYDCSQRDHSPEFIIPRDCILAPVHRSIEDTVHVALRGVKIPDEVPEGCLFVPKDVWSDVLQWGHASALAGY